ncbi:MAG TPA: ABC transporter permease [Pyrinomonadaceae bacterium]|nr:ABC transporter permease [Pyrinomonadaceae bacterium]
MESLFTDIRFSFRSLVNQPGFTLVAILTLALGIGANTAIFSVVNAVLLRPLPFKDSGRVVMIWNNGAEAAGGDRTPLAVADLQDVRSQSRSFESFGAFQNGTFNYTSGEVPEQLRGLGVTANLLSLLGAVPQIGRDFQTADEQVGAERTILISDRFWHSHFGADKQVVGRRVNLSGISTTIIGVMPAGLDFPSRDIDLWRAMQLEQPTRRGPYFLTGVGRLKPGVQVQQARAESLTLKSTLGNYNLDFNVLPVNEFIFGDSRPALIALFVAVTLVLLIAAVNVANLTLVRAASRLKEISIRTALGASRGRVIRRLLTESLLLAIAGGVFGTLCAFWGVSALAQFAPENLPRVNQIKIDGFVLLWTGVVTLLTGLAFGLVPAWQGSRLNLNEVLRDGGRGSTESAGRRRGRSVLVIAELALAVMLLTGAGLLIKSLWRLQRVDLGINPERVVTMQMSLHGQRYEKPEAVRELNSRVVEQTRTLPGVRAAALTNSLPPDETEFSSDFTIEGKTPVKDVPQIAYFNLVSTEYFQALGIPLRAGRIFSSSDLSDSPRVILINETLRRRFFPGEDPVGKRLNLSIAGKPDWAQIVGVVGDVKYNGMADDVQPAIYQPIEQQPAWGFSLILKTDVADALSLTTAARNEISKLDPSLPVTNVSTMEQRVATAMAPPRFRTTLIALFAAVALILACIGIYGVISYSVTQRTHEIGIRIALGAQRRNVLRLVLGQGALLAVIGVVLGLTGAFALTRLMASLLFGVTPTDAAIFTFVPLGLTAIAMLASYLPARRATKVDPLVALRYE